MSSKDNKIISTNVKKDIDTVNIETPKQENVKYIGSKIFENKTMTIKRKSPIGLGIKVLGYVFISYLICLLSFPIVINSTNTFTKIVTQILYFIISFSFVYIPTWYEGNRDAKLVKQEKFKYDPNRAIISGVVCVVPHIINYMILLASKLLNIQSLYNLYRVLSTHFLGINLLLSPTSYVADLENWHLILFFALPFTFLFYNIFGYNMGYNGTKILSKDIFKKKVNVENL